MQPHFVIVEDDEQIAWVMTEQLRVERPGSVVHTFFDPFSALEHLRRKPADLLITDLHMAGMSGFDLLHRTRQFAPELPVIMITADQSREAQRAAAHYGVREYLPKPFELDTLLTTIQRLLDSPQAGTGWPNGLAVPQSGVANGAARAEAAAAARTTLTSDARLPLLSALSAHLESAEALTRQPGAPANAQPEPPTWQTEAVEIVPLLENAPVAEFDANVFDEDFELLTEEEAPAPPKNGAMPASVLRPADAPGTALEVGAKPLADMRHFPHDALCRRFSRHLEELHWCALLDFETRAVLGFFEAHPAALLGGLPASSISETDLLALTENLLWPPLLSKLGLQSPAANQGRAAQEVQLVFPDCILLAKALDEDKFALVLQSGSRETLPKLWEQLRKGLLAEGLVVEDSEPEAWPMPETESGNWLSEGHWAKATNELTAELLAHFYPKEAVDLVNQPLQFSEPGRRTQTLRLEMLPAEAVGEPAAPATPVLATPRPDVQSLPHPPWPGRNSDAELVTPMWMADVLLSEIGPYEPRLRTDLIKSKPGAWLYQLGRYCLRTSVNKRFPDRPSAEAAIQVCLRDHTALGELHAGDTFFVLTPDEEGQYWLWTVSAWLITLEAELTLALKQQDEVALAAGLCKFAEAILCSLQLALEKRLILTVEPANFATVYEGGPLVYMDDEIEHGYCLANVGQTILSLAEQYADWPQAVSVYLDVLGVGVCSRFKREQVRRLDLLRSLREVPVNTPALQHAQSRLIDRIRRCPE